MGTSNNSQDPVTKVGCSSDFLTVFHIGYYQDTTDDPTGGRPGHFQSLEIVPSQAVPCCNLVAVTGGEVLGDVEFSDSLITIEKILKEEDILKANDERLVKLSLERLLSLKLSVSDLFNTNITCILYNDVRTKFSAKSSIGKLCRRLLFKCQDLCRSDPEFDGELPDVTDISEDEGLEPQAKKKDFRSLFCRRSNIVAQMGCGASLPSSHTFSVNDIASSTIVCEDTDVPVNITDAPVSITDTVDSMFDGLGTATTTPPPKRRRGRPAKPVSPLIYAAGHSVELTPPPPVSPATPPRKARGRPRKNKSPQVLQKRGRGRPRKNV